MTLRVTVVVGNPKPLSRTRQVAETLVEHVLDDGSYELSVIELAEYQSDIFSWEAERVSALNDEVAGSDLVVFASPTYKATYTGLLKAFLDRYPADGLAGVVAIPVLTGGSPAHSLAATHELLPLLAELGAIIPGRGLYFEASEIDRVDEIVRPAASVYRANLARLARVAEAAPASGI